MTMNVGKGGAIRKDGKITGVKAAWKTREIDFGEDVSSPHVSKGSMEDSQSYRRQVCEGFIKNLVDLHALDYNTAGLGDLGHPSGYARRQVEGWSKRYFAAKTDDAPKSSGSCE